MGAVHAGGSSLGQGDPGIHHGTEASAFAEVVLDHRSSHPRTRAAVLDRRVESYHNPNMQHPVTWYEEHVDPPAEPTGLVWKWSPAERRFVCEVTPIAGIGKSS